MRMARAPVLLLAAVLASSVLTASLAHAQTTDQTVQTAGRGQFKVDDIIDRMSQAERAVHVRLRTFHPLIEVYIQNLASDEARGWVPTDDNYFLGQFHFDNTPTLRPIGRKEPRRLISRVTAPNLGDAFASMLAPDWRVLERKRYEFKYVRREFLGESRCFVFDVRPLRDGKDGFLGRIWVEDRDYNLVRFNGINRETDLRLSGLFKRSVSFHVDGWRVNVTPGLWLPSYVYSEETDLNNASSSARRARFKSQTRIWGYQAQSV